METLTPTLYGIFGILVLVLGVPVLLWLAVVVRNRLLARMALSGLSYSLMAIAATVLPILMLEGAIVLQAVFAYDGSCYGFTDGHWPCARADFILADASYGVFFLIPVAALYAPATLFVFILGWRRRSLPRSV